MTNIWVSDVTAQKYIYVAVNHIRISLRTSKKELNLGLGLPLWNPNLVGETRWGTGSQTGVYIYFYYFIKLINYIRVCESGDLVPCVSALLNLLLGSSSSFNEQKRNIYISYRTKCFCARAWRAASKANNILLSKVPQIIHKGLVAEVGLDPLHCWCPLIAFLRVVDS